MPQMAPILWMPLYLTLTSMIYLTMAQLYFNYPQLNYSPTPGPLSGTLRLWKW